MRRTRSRDVDDAVVVEVAQGMRLFGAGGAHYNTDADNNERE